MSTKERDMYRKYVSILVASFTKEELETIYIQNEESMAAVAQAILSKKLLKSFEG